MKKYINNEITNFRQKELKINENKDIGTNLI